MPLTQTTAKDAPQRQPDVQDFAPCASRLLLHSFKDVILDTPVHFQLLMLQGSLFLWIGDNAADMSNLSVALKSPFVSKTLFFTFIVGLQSIHKHD